MQLSPVSSWTNIINGGVDITGIVFNSVATYTCNEGYRLNGERQRTCLSSGDWSAAEPQCLSKGNKGNTSRYYTHCIIAYIHTCTVKSKIIILTLFDRKLNSCWFFTACECVVSSCIYQCSAS